MEATFNLPINILNEEFIRKLQELFSKNAMIELKIIDTIQDETDYLFSTPENKEMLEKSIKQLQNNQIINKTVEELAK